jgi:hypothetical protein
MVANMEVFNRIVMRDGVPVVESVCLFCGRWASIENGWLFVVSMAEMQRCCHRCALEHGYLGHTGLLN